MFKKTLILLLGLMLCISVSIMCYANEDDVIRIGFYGPLTGNMAAPGNESLEGTQIAVDEINAAGGLLGKQIEVIAYDDKSSPEQAVKAVTRLIEADKVHAIVGSLHSGNILVSAPVVEKAKIPEVGVGTSPVWLQQGYEYLFRSLQNTGVGAKAIMRAAKEMDLKTIAILYLDDEYGHTGEQDVTREAEINGLKVVAKEAIPVNDSDFTGQLVKIINAKPDALFIFVTTSYFGPATKQARQLGFDKQIFGCESYASQSVKDIAGEAANGVVFFATYIVPRRIEDSYDPLLTEFLKAYMDRYKKLPDESLSFRTYDAVNIIAKGIIDSGSLDGTAIRDAIENITDLKGLAGVFNFKGNNGEGLDDIRLWIIKDGKDYPFDPSKI